MRRNITTSGEGAFTIDAAGSLGSGDLILTLRSNGQVVDELTITPGDFQETLLHGYVIGGQRVQVNLQFNQVNDLDLSFTWADAG